jgi:hypothetical protein
MNKGRREELRKGKEAKKGSKGREEGREERKEGKKGGRERREGGRKGTNTPNNECPSHHSPAGLYPCGYRLVPSTWPFLTTAAAVAPGAGGENIYRWVTNENFWLSAGCNC